MFFLLPSRRLLEEEVVVVEMVGVCSRQVAVGEEGVLGARGTLKPPLLLLYESVRLLSVVAVRRVQLPLEWAAAWRLSERLVAHRR